jgi:hypothetical protein
MTVADDTDTFYTARLNPMQGPVAGWFVMPTGERIPDWQAAPTSRFEVYNAETGNVISKPVPYWLARDISGCFNLNMNVPVYAIRRIDAS